jgi:malate dehydrogenase (oxaloacetate-decarboxylating)
LSQANLLTSDDIKLMNKDSIVFAMANPTPEINPEDAIAGGAKVVATGRSDYPNQINNVLVFPGMFKGAIETSTNFVTDEIKLKAAESLAAIVDDPTQDNIIPGVFDAGVVDAIVDAFKS